MPFRFRLQPLITIRDNVLKQKQAELAKAYEARRIVMEKREKVERDLAATKESAREMIHSGKPVSVDYLLGLRREEMFLLIDRNKCDEDLRMIDEYIERCREAVIEANKELKIVEKLKEKRKEKYDTEQARLETVQMDEIAGRPKHN